MRSLDNILDELDQFDLNMQGIRNVLDALNKVNEDYVDAIHGPKKVLGKVEEANAIFKASVVAIEERIKNVVRELEGLKTEIANNEKDMHNRLSVIQADIELKTLNVVEKANESVTESVQIIEDRIGSILSEVKELELRITRNQQEMYTKHSAIQVEIEQAMVKLVAAIGIIENNNEEIKKNVRETVRPELILLSSVIENTEAEIRKIIISQNDGIDKLLVSRFEKINDVLIHSLVSQNHKNNFILKSLLVITLSSFMLSVLSFVMK